MKRKFLTKVGIAAIALSLSTWCLTGCGLLFGGDDDDDDDKDSKVTYSFSVKYGEETLNYSFKNKNDIKIDPRYKAGSVLSGFYTQENGQGAMLLDYRGSCVGSSFSGDGKTVLYPFYEDIDYDYVFKMPTLFETEAKTAGYNVYKSPSLSYSSLSKYEEYEYLARVAASNADMRFDVSVAAEMQNGGWGEIGIGIAKQVDKSNLTIKQSFETTKSYQQYTLKGTVGAAEISADGANCIIGFTCHGFMKNLNYRKVQITISIVNDNAESENDEE